ncbi:DUF2244 domain-containing protein [Rhizobium sp. DBTS2]|uniref:DUF2244 domain-containing protein n=1 Tax=Mycoplana rhizolycopersici TaxID=2746702 RepID=A0ABX2QKC3_9HYPH|nr:DUF2244 domain-containing protein [Rhizobium rhizolycopersici]
MSDGNDDISLDDRGLNDRPLNDRPVFFAELRPHRSLGQRGHFVFFLIAGMLTVAHMAIFLVSGAWPIVMFFGADFLILFGAFWLNNRAARACELVEVSRTSISIRKRAPSGFETAHEFNPFWARFKVSRKEEIGITDMSVSGQGRRTDVGSFLHLDDRERFAATFAGALARVKRGL